MIALKTSGTLWNHFAYPTQKAEYLFISRAKP